MEQGLHELESDADAAESFVGIGTVRAVGIENGERGRQDALGQVMIGDDDVHAERTGAFDDGGGADSGVHADDELDAVGCRRFHLARVHAVAVAETIRNLEADRAARHFNGTLQDDRRGSAIHVVVAVDLHRLAVVDGALNARHGAIHIAQQEGIVQVVERRREVASSGGGGGKASGAEDLSDGARDAESGR